MNGPTPPHLYACYFTGTKDVDIRQWSALAKVMAFTAEKHCHHWTRTIEAITPEKVTSAIGRISHVYNTQKLEWWCDAIANASLGDRVLLIDADTAILRSIDDIWEKDFDVAYTIRDRAATKLPINGGVVFVRVSDASKAFVEAWRAENRRMLLDKHWRMNYGEYGGINQASWMTTVKRKDALGVHALQLHCREWNCEDSTWRTFDPMRTRILHIKSELKRAVFSGPNQRVQPFLRPLAAKWKDIEQQAERRLEQDVPQPDGRRITDAGATA